ncbi:MAG: hypothetical protein KAR45_18015 [Desulfobacteraceae bacterium]|nr:hypothetical protein [Desulfobacteraceae bacterium]
MKLASGFTEQPGYRSIYDDIESLEQVLNRGGNLTVALLESKTIVGLAVLDYPDAKQRWAQLGNKSLLEVKAVEVFREFRNYQIAYYLLSGLFSFPKIEQKIIYLAGYSWTWDLAYSDMNEQSYRQMLINLYSGFGFMEYPTNEPNICLKPENIFMVRVGKNVSEKTREKFKWLRFGLSL